MHIPQSKPALTMKKVLTKNKNASSFMLLFKDEIHQLKGLECTHRHRTYTITDIKLEDKAIHITMDDNETVITTADLLFKVKGIKEDIICVDINSSVYTHLKTRGNRYKWKNENIFHITKHNSTLAVVGVVRLIHRSV